MGNGGRMIIDGSATTIHHNVTGGDSDTVCDGTDFCECDMCCTYGLETCAAELSTMNTNVTMTRGRKVSSVSSNSREEELSTILTAFNEFPFATLYARRMLHSGHAKVQVDLCLFMVQ